jgi:hypothetical protein
MKRVSLARSIIFAIIFALAAALLGVGAGTARAAVILLDVSGSMFAGSPSASKFCGPPLHPTCSLGGDIVIGNSTNVVLAGDVTVTTQAGLFEFDRVDELAAELGLTEVKLGSSSAGGGDAFLFFSTPTAGSLVGYTGGPLSSKTSVSIGQEPSIDLNLASGSLTEANAAVPIPEPSSLLLMVTAIAGVSTIGLVKRLWGGVGLPRSVT